MLTKDRYSQAFITMAGSALLSIYFLRNDKGNIAALSALPFLIGTAYMIYLFTRPAKLHLSEEQKKRLNAEYKGENDCKFSPEYKTDVDGLRISGKRYKFVNGTDIYINENNEVKSCGIGSDIMQFIGGGGLEPKSIQSNVCWE